MKVSSIGKTQPAPTEAQVSSQISSWWQEVAASTRAGQIPRALRHLRWIAVASPDDRDAQLWLHHLSHRQREAQGSPADQRTRKGPKLKAIAKTGLKIGIAIVISLLGLALLPFLQLSLGRAEWRTLDTTLNDSPVATPTSSSILSETQQLPCAELPEPGEPLAALVGEQGIGQNAFERELDQFLAELADSGIDLEGPQVLADMPGYRRQVLDQLVEDVVVQQAAASAGITVTEDQMADFLEAELGTAEAQTEFKRELEAKGQSWEEFLHDTCQALLRQSVLEQVTTEITGTMEMVWARQIVVQTQQDAQNALARLAAGEDFAELAQELSLDSTTRDQGGDLGWFPRGLGQVAIEVEEAAFSGSPGLVQGPISVDDQFYLVQTVDLQPDRPVDPELAASLREADFKLWLSDQVAATEVVIYMDLYELPDGVATPEVVPETGAGIFAPAWVGLTVLGVAFLLAGGALRTHAPVSGGKADQS